MTRVRIPSPPQLKNLKFKTMIVKINEGSTIDTKYIVKITHIYKPFGEDFEFIIYHIDTRYTTIKNKDEHKLKCLYNDLLKYWSDDIKQINFYK